MSNDFVLSKGGAKVELLSRDFDDWRITFVDTGMHFEHRPAPGRRAQIRRSEAMFLANYSDGLSDLPLRRLRGRVPATRRGRQLYRRAAGAEFSRGKNRPGRNGHGAGACVGVGYLGQRRLHVLRADVFDYMKPGEELVEQPFGRLIAERKLWAPRHRGFWAAMDTFKDKINFDRMEARGECPWMVWKR